MSAETPRDYPRSVRAGTESVTLRHMGAAVEEFEQLPV